MPIRNPLIAAAAGLALAAFAGLSLPEARGQEQAQPAQSAPAIPVGREMTTLERELLREEIRAYLLEHPEVIMEAVQVLEERRKAAEAADDAALVAAHRAQLLDDGFSWVGGNPDGDVTLVEFSDYRCPYCKRAHGEVRALLAQDPNLRYVLKEFPILGPDSIAIARMALAAAEIDPARFEELNDRLMRFPGQLSEDVAYRLAAEAGWDIGRLRARAGEPEIENRIADTYRLARALRISGTPAFVVGDTIVRGFVPEEDLRDLVAKAREAMN